MKDFQRWLRDHPGEVLLWILIFGGLFAVTMMVATGCCSKRPRFMDGDATALGPKTWGEVVEPDMAKPQRK